MQFFFFKSILFIFLLGGLWTTTLGRQLAMAVASGDSVAEKSANPISKNPRAAMIRSIVLPGWGQFYNEKWLKGVIIAGAECGLVINAIVQNQYALNSVTTLDKEYYANNRNLSYWWLAGVILYSAVDAYVDAHLFNFDESPNLTLNLVPENSGGFLSPTNFYCQLSWRF